MASEVAFGLRNVQVGLESRMVLQQANLSVPTGSMTDLTRRNGAGKSTLLRLLTGREARYVGEALTLGRKLPEAASGMVYLTAEHWSLGEDQRLRDLARHVARVHPDLDMEHATELLTWSGVPESRHPMALSHGQRTVILLSLVLAARAPLTLLGKPYNGLDMPARQRPTRVLSEKLHMFPRTLLIPTHLVDEIEPLLQYVALMEGGRVTTAGAVRGLATSFTRVSGPVVEVDAFPRLRWLDREGAWASAVVRGGTKDGLPARPVSFRELANLLIGPRHDVQVDAERGERRRAETSVRCYPPLVDDSRGATGGP